MKILFGLILLLSPALLPAQWTGVLEEDPKTHEWRWIRPSVPPPLHRPAIPARILPGGKGRSGFHFDRLIGTGQNYSVLNPFDANGQLTAFGAQTRWGLQPGGVEFLGAIDWPFFVPSVLIRIQPLGRNLEYGPYVTLELGLDALPDAHAGLALGASYGPLLEASVAGRWGWVLDRGYQEYGAVLTLHASRAFDLNLGLSQRSYLAGPPNGELWRGSLTLEYGNLIDSDEP